MKSGLGLFATPAGSPLDVGKGPGSIAPLGAELWPFKEGNHKKNSCKSAAFCQSIFKHAYLSILGVEWSFEKNQKHQINSLPFASHTKRT